MNLPTVAAARLVDLDMAGYHIDSTLIIFVEVDSTAESSVLIERLLSLITICTS